MDNKERFYTETKFGGFTDIDGTVAFFNRVNSLLDSSFVVLDVGCGRGGYNEDPVRLRKNLRILKGKVAKVIGIDVDKNAQDNPFLDERAGPTNLHNPISGFSVPSGHDTPQQNGEPHEQTIPS